jgi:glycosyltransferase involved in cell wall biosynthesis
MIVFDLTLATRSNRLTGIERFGINLFETWAAKSDNVLALTTTGIALRSSKTFELDQPPLRAWFEAPLWIPKETVCVVFPSFPPSPMFLCKRLPYYRVIHDTVPFRHPETMSLRGRVLFRDLERLFLHRYRKVFSPTEIVARDLQDRFHSLKVVMCGNAPGLDFSLVTPDPPLGMKNIDSFLLAVGTLEPRKNYSALINLFRCSAPTGLKLVIVGRAGWGDIESSVRDAAAKSDCVLWLQNATDSNLHWLYSNCMAFISFSLVEGFNMPLVEAGCFGRPLLVSDIDIHRVVAAPWTKFVSLTASPSDFRTALDEVLQLEIPAHDSLSYRMRFSWSDIVQSIQKHIMVDLNLQSSPPS